MNYLVMALLQFSVLFSAGNEKKIQAASNGRHAINCVAPQQYCWRGTLNNKTPVVISYQVNDSIITGHIVYQNTKDKKPIRLIGTIETDRSLRLLEFEATGNITGIITGTPSEKEFNGSWFSPKTRKELTLKAVKKDSAFALQNIETNLAQVFGSYHYQYSEAGYQGDLEIKKLPQQKAVFEISSVTGEPSRNIAQIDADTITLNKTQFVYTLAETDDCQFKVQFYKDFVYIKYTRGYCDGQFGHNATVEGIFLKVR